MKLLLTAKNWSRYSEPANNPITLLDLAPVARVAGWEVDCYYLDQVPSLDYDLIGVSVLSGYRDVLRDLRGLREHFPKVAITVGGKWTKTISDEVATALEVERIEVCAGSGEAFFEAEFDRYPSWDARDAGTLNVRRQGLMTSRGCPYRCAFCHNTEKTIRFFPPERTVDNIELLFRRGVQRIFFVDDIFTISAAHMRRVHEECERRQLTIAGRNMFFTHVNCITPETIAAMKLLEPSCVQIGIESGDDDMLQAMEKGFTAEEALQKVRLLQAGGIRVKPLFLIGFPGETPNSLRRTLELAKAMRPFTEKPWVSYFQPVPGTVGHDLALELGRILHYDNLNTAVAYVDEKLTASALVRYRGRITGL